MIPLSSDKVQLMMLRKWRLSGSDKHGMVSMVWMIYAVCLSIFLSAQRVCSNYITHFYVTGDYFAIECSTYEQPHDVQPHDVYGDRKTTCYREILVYY